MTVRLCMRMLNILSDGKIYTKQELSERLNVSTKQVERYRKALDEIAEIEVKVGMKGGYKFIRMKSNLLID